ncbi:MAG: imidazole glycerol phosphate synthase subunit HisH [Chloroflexi bacterium]|nr:imidazole glycerol phosphate synthase subunit HisH [Chloroflexota bacterium]
MVVAVVDYGAGNLVSIEQAVAATGGLARIVKRPDELDGADLLLVPGVGAAAPAMRRLERAGLAGAIVSWIERGKPFLGICLGLQLLFESSEEDGARTLGVIPGRTVRLEGAPTLPHIGWNQVELRREHPVFDGVEPGEDVYFVHSYAGVPVGAGADEWIVGETEHGVRFVSAVARDNVVGLQFHPERSGAVGLRVLANVLAWAGVRSALGAGASA